MAEGKKQSEWADFEDGKEFDFAANTTLEAEKQRLKEEEKKSGDGVKTYSKNKGFFDTMTTSKMGDETDETVADWEGGPRE